ncbi:MAG TPA: hypothetical protein VHO24_17015 [Opitutaceae bacterium]|nr:hypothetical protein [Opitutaceae bacterium]
MMFLKNRPRRWWLILVVCAAGYFSLFAARPSLLSPVGVNYFGVWFLDSYAILSSNEALARGFDVRAPNPLDYLHRPHVYSHWWLRLGGIGLTRADNFSVGLVLVVLFFLVAVAGLRPRSLPETIWYLLVLISSPVLLAMHRANNDLVIFILLAPVVPCLLSPGRPVRVLGMVLIAVATALKYYPAAAALLLIAGERPRDGKFSRRIAAVISLSVGLALIPDLPDLKAMLTATKAEGLMTFGAGNLFIRMGFTGWTVTGLSVLAGGLIAAGFFAARKLPAWTVAPADRGVWLSFVLGAALLTGCFLTGMNFAYRWVFALWLAPYLWSLWHDPLAPAALRRLARWTAALLMVVLWADPLACLVFSFMRHVPGDTLVRWANAFFYLEQPFTWAFFACLIGFLVQFVRGGLRSRVA